MSDQYVADDERDAILDRLLTLPENKVCFDCKSKNPKWASSSIGIFLCYQCTSIHRNLGVHISFVRSLKMDRWKLKELKQMELGGNKNAQVYFEKNGMYTDGKPNHKAPQLQKYKADLLRRVEMEIGSSVQSNAKNHGNVEHQGSAVFNTVPPFGGLSTIKDNTVVSEQAQMKTNTIGISGNSNNFFEEMKEQQPQVKNKTTSLIQQNSSSGGLTFGLGGMTKQTEVKTLNAKKLDVNFDNDDFFNSFEPTKQQQPMVKEASFGQNQNSGQRLQEITNENNSKSQPKNNSHVFNMDNQQFSFGGTPIQSSSNAKFTSPSDEYEAQQRLKSLGNKKGISSEDIFGHREPKSDEVVQRYNQLAGARAISSDMFFGNQNQPNSNQNLGDEVEGYMLGRNSTNSNNSYDEYKEQAAKIAEKVQENAKILKEKALDWLSTFTQ